MNTDKEMYMAIERGMTRKVFLRRMGMTKKNMLQLLRDHNWKEGASQIARKKDLTCGDILNISRKTLDSLCPEPACGWMQYCYNETLLFLFPDAEADPPEDRYEKGRLFFCEMIRIVHNYRKSKRPISPIDDFEILTRGEASKERTGAEYSKFVKTDRQEYIFEFMKIGAEITPFNTFSHVAGVHYVAMHVGRQLKKLGVPLDLALVSASAATHDIGKFGCKKSEASRVAHLHYYYTDVCLQRLGMPTVAHIAGNHSTWDLELEDLSAESLVLIYADFRVKSNRDSEGREIVRFYSLSEAFDVILSKLENVDAAKEARYRRVYNKLHDFEEYMVSIGVEPDIYKEGPNPKKWRTAALLDGDEVTDRIKFLAIRHNIEVMSRFGNETDFAGLLEEARGDRNWKNVRAYVNTLKEYFEYMSQPQKQMTIGFLKELSVHREGDIRRMAAALAGEVIAGYDEEYRKERPAGAAGFNNPLSSRDLWQDYIRYIIYPDLTSTEQQKRWMGYSFKTTLTHLLDNVAEKDRRSYINDFLYVLREKSFDEATVFIILDTLLEIPAELYSEHAISETLDYCEYMSGRGTVEIKVAILRLLRRIAEAYSTELSGDAEIQGSTGSGMNNAVNREMDGTGSVNETPVVAAKTSDIATRALSADARNASKAISPELSARIAKICDEVTGIKGAGLQADHRNTAGIPKNTGRGTGERVCIVYLKYKIYSALSMREETREYREQLIALEKGAPDIFRDNLKVGTPWNIKVVNIELLLEQLDRQRRGADKIIEEFYVATHLSNLLKVSERVTVRHAAGRGLIRIFDILSRDRRNELVIELTKGLEIGDYQFSKYIPDCLGVLVTFLHPDELDEAIHSFEVLMQTGNEKVASVTLDTLGVIINNFMDYKHRFNIYAGDHSGRIDRILGMIMKGMSDYHDAVSEEAFMVLGQTVFGSDTLSLEDKSDIFCRISKKMITLIDDNDDNKEETLRFFNNAAALNHLYRFISEYIFRSGSFPLPRHQRVAFFPGTFDPFSLGHKGIVSAIRDLGFEVYLALDEFSWSKKTQPRLLRKKIMTMSCADENDVYVFPDDIPVNIANPDDIAALKDVFAGRELFLVVGSDVIANASSYRSAASENSVHTLNHIVFRRESHEQGGEADEAYSEHSRNIKGHIIELTLPVHLEDISSTRIRDNIDEGNDISNLIDPVAQSYIYENALYLREPQYKNIMDASNLSFTTVKKNGRIQSVELTYDRDDEEMKAVSHVHLVKAIDLYSEFGDDDLSGYIREQGLGKILIIDSIEMGSKVLGSEVCQLLVTETLAEALRYDYTYAVYKINPKAAADKYLQRVLKRQGFSEIMINDRATGCLAVDMRNPVLITRNIQTVLKNPFNKNIRVAKAIKKAHIRMQEALVNVYPDTLILSVDSMVMNQRVMEKVTAENEVPSRPLPKRLLGPAMCVPFGKILTGMVVPNTVTKTLHLEKCFYSDLQSFEIREAPFYSSVNDQVKTIKSFMRPVILVDDVLHKGFRVKMMDSLLNKNHVEVQKLIVGILSGRGRDLITKQRRGVDSVYFIPNLRATFTESWMYPFIGGDGVYREGDLEKNKHFYICMVLPYAVSDFMKDRPIADVYRFSMVCLENSRDILRTIEEEYQKEFKKKLTMDRLSEAIVSPGTPDVGECLDFDRGIAASEYLDSDIEKLQRLRSII